jgi:type IV pilus assembly protein PilQ
VNDTPSKLEEIQQLIAKIDIAVRQVLIEARIVEADDSFGRALGIKLGGSDVRGIRGGTPGYSVGGDNRVTVGGNYAAIGNQTQQPGATAGYNDTQFVNLPANTSSLGVNAATFALSLFGATANRFLNLELSALEQEGRGNIVSSPTCHHRGPNQGTHRAGRRNSLPAGHVERRHFGAVQEGKPAAGSDAADHARGQCDPEPGSQ